MLFLFFFFWFVYLFVRLFGFSGFNLVLCGSKSGAVVIEYSRSLLVRWVGVLSVRLKGKQWECERIVLWNGLKKNYLLHNRYICTAESDTTEVSNQIMEDEHCVRKDQKQCGEDLDDVNIFFALGLGS